LTPDDDPRTGRAERLLVPARSDLRIALAGFLVCNVMPVLQPRFGVAGLMCCVPVGALAFGQARIASRTLLMASVPESRIGGVFGVANGCGLAATAVVMLVVSAVTDHSDTRYGFATLAAISTAAAVAAGVLLMRRGIRPGRTAHDVRGNRGEMAGL
jgi:MFS-type transporter involved in bile tolerance (Atg22 family)